MKLRLLASFLLLATFVPSIATADPNDGLVAHWTLDDTPGDRAADSLGVNHGTVRGAALGQAGIVGGAAEFHAAQDAIIECGAGTQLDRGNQLTIAAFVRPESFNPLDAANRANSRNGILGDADARLIFSLTDQGRLVFIWDAGDRKYQTITTEAADSVPLGVFSHLAVTRNGSTMILYIDGSPRAVASSFASGNFVRLGNLAIGRVNNSTARDFDGRIDDVRVYDRALSAEEIRQLAQTDRLAESQPARSAFGGRGLERMLYNNPGLTVDLGVGLWAWPLPMDYDGDGDLDLLVSCSDVPYRGTFFFENPGGDAKTPRFKPAVLIGGGLGNVEVSYVDGKPRVLTPGFESLDVPANGLASRVKLSVGPRVDDCGKIRANQWKYVDYDGDARLDLIVGVGDWEDYGWDNAFDSAGHWTRGPLHGYVYLLRNAGTNDRPEYEEAVKLQAAGKPIDVFGMPSPCMEDFDGDGDLDLICGEFVDKFTWFENVGTRTAPEYAAGRFLSRDGEPIRMDLCMITPTSVDWDGDGDVDLIVGQEDGRVAFLENTGRVSERMPVFEPPRFFQQEAHEVKFGALATPVGFDWDGDGDEDLVSGNTAGYIGFIENLGGLPPRWAEPVYIQADGRPIRVEAGYNGSIQGPCEAEWGYTTISVADWDHDGLPDIVANSIWGKVHWYRNVGTPQSPKLEAARAIEVQWEAVPPKPPWNWWNPKGNELATQWRTTPAVVDMTGDGLVDLVMLDHEGYLALYERVRLDGQLHLLPPKRVFHAEGPSVFSSNHGIRSDQSGPLRLNDGEAGRSGRRKLCLADWDGDGLVDLLVNSRSVDLLKNLGERDGRIVFQQVGPLDNRRLAGHTTSPTVVDWDANGVPDLLVGAEDGYFYYLRNPRAPEEGE